MRIISVVGARPQFVKAAAVSRALRAQPGVTERLVHTGQHYDDNLSAVFFEELEIPAPDYELRVGSGTHGAQTGRMLEAVEMVLLDERPDWVLVYGDTNSTLAGALAAAKLHLPLAHVEAGLRSYNRRMPEELNRVLTDHAADLLLAPTKTAVENLMREGIKVDQIRLVGDVMLDVALHHAARAEARSRILERLGLEPDGYVLATVHRAETTDDPERLRAVFLGLTRVAEELPVIVPLHPRTRKALEAAGLPPHACPGLRLTEPVGYLDMVKLERHARLIATDSGGVQKEAFFYQRPCVTLRDETEWVELVELGWNRVVAPRSPEAVEAGIRGALGMAGRPGSPYGEGRAAEAIAMALLRSEP